MPYIAPQLRPLYDDAIQQLVLALDPFDGQTAGDLNYIITSIVKGLLSNHQNYARWNAIIGALECCKQELYRRHVGPYEDEAIERNGDVT